MSNAEPTPEQVLAFTRKFRAFLEGLTPGEAEILEDFLRGTFERAGGDVAGFAMHPGAIGAEGPLVAALKARLAEMR